MSVASTVYSAQQQRAQGRYKKGVADYNARVSENEAQEVRSAGVEAENIQRRKTAELLSKQKAQIGASGIELSSGSALQLQEDTTTLGEADALRIRSNFEAKALSLETGADLTRGQGEFAKSAGAKKALGTVLGGGAKFADTGVADKWFKPDSVGSVSQSVFASPKKSGIAGIPAFT